MATKFRIASLALQRAKADPTPLNVARAIEKCRDEYARGGSIASMDMLRRAEALAVAFAPAEEN